MPDMDMSQMDHSGMDHTSHEGHDMPAPQAAAPPQPAATNATEITVAGQTWQRFGIRSQKVVRGPLQPVIEAFGSLTYDAQRTAHIHTRANGWVRNLVPRAVGQRVSKGDLLFEYFSPEIASAFFEFVRSSAAEGARRKLISMGVAERQIGDIARTRQVPDGVQVFAPQDGAVVTLNLAEGMYVTPDMTLISLGDPNHLWLVAEVFPEQSAQIKPGQEAQIRFSDRPNLDQTALISYLYPEINARSRTLSVRLILDNPDPSLRPGQYAQVQLTMPPREALSVPADAVIQTGQGARVIRSLGEGRLLPVAVQIGARVGDDIEILNGLDEGAEVVTNAAFLIDSESSVQAAMRRMGGTGGGMAGHHH